MANVTVTFGGSIMVDGVYSLDFIQPYTQGGNTWYAIYSQRERDYIISGIEPNETAAIKAWRLVREQGKKFTRIVSG